MHSWVFVLHTTNTTLLQAFIDDVCTRRTISDSCGSAF
jgi:hypothetical protein